MSSLTLGPFVIAPDGSLAPPPGPEPARIRFMWRGRRCEARVTDARMDLLAFIGRVPSTAERGADRGMALAALRDLPRALPKALRLVIAPDHTVRLVASGALARPASAVTLVAALVGFVLAFDPYLDTLDAGASGRAKT